MILDSSAVIAVLRAELEALAMARVMDRAEAGRISAVSHVEAAIVMDSGRDPISSRRFDDFFREAGIIVEPVTLRQARLAREAYRDFGRGAIPRDSTLETASPMRWRRRCASGCCSKDDFRHTDVEAADD